jgi:hypothetical protein
MNLIPLEAMLNEEFGIFSSTFETGKEAVKAY